MKHDYSVILTSLILINTIVSVTCYASSWQTVGKSNINSLKNEALLRSAREKRSAAFRAYRPSNFMGMQTRINNQFAEFQMQAAVFAENIHHDNQLYISVAKTAKLFRTRIVIIFFIAYFLFFIFPVLIAAIMALCICRSLGHQIDACVDPPEDGSKLPRLANRPAGFYVPLHRKPLIYLQAFKENYWPGYKERAHENYLKRKRKNKNKGKNSKTPQR